jgi:Protein of unknown function (DUF3551)
VYHNGILCDLAGGLIICRANKASDAREMPMPKPVLALLLVGAALRGDSEIVQAQTAVAAYPWCAIYSTGLSAGFRSCYFSSREQCVATMSGIGGLCVVSPYYHPQAAPSPRRAEAQPRRRRH